MDMNDILGGLNKILGAVKMLTPYVPGGPLITAGIEIAENVLAKKDTAEVVMSSQDEQEIRDIVEQLHEENNKLDAEIRNS